MRARGLMTDSFFERPFPSGTLRIERDRLELSAFSYRHLVLPRTEIARVLVRKARKATWWVTYLVFQRTDDAFVPAMFAPVRWRRAARELSALGWDVAVGDPLLWRDHLLEPMPADPSKRTDG